MYIGICAESGAMVPDDEAFQYALEHIVAGTEEEKQEFLDWYFSGNWIKE